jgi:hypothetical protein
MTQESTIEGYLVKRVKALGGIALKGDIPGHRWLDRICILPEGVTLWIEVKRPKGGVVRPLQEETIRMLLEMQHFAFLVKTKEEVDIVLDNDMLFHAGQLHAGPPKPPFVSSYLSTPKGLVVRT